MDVNRVSYTPAPSTGQGVDAPAPMPVQSPSPAPVEVSAPVEVRGQVSDGGGGRDVGEPLQRAVREINTTMSSYHRHLAIRMHEATGRRVVTVYDSDTNEILREIPPERVLDAHASMLEAVGLFMDTRG